VVTREAAAALLKAAAKSQRRTESHDQDWTILIAYERGAMKFNQLERVLIVSCAAVFILAAADGLNMTWVCPASGPGSCSDRPTTEERTISAAAETLAADGYAGKTTARLNVPAAHEAND
jgi:hypothetical protein